MNPATLLWDRIDFRVSKSAIIGQMLMVRATSMTRKVAAMNVAWATTNAKSAFRSISRKAKDAIKIDKNSRTCRDSDRLLRARPRG